VWTESTLQISSVPQPSDLRTVKNQLWQSEISRIWGLEFLQVLWTADQRFRKPFSPPYSSLLRLTQAHTSQSLREIRTLAGVGWNELE